MDVVSAYSTMVDALFWENDEDESIANILSNLDGPEEVPCCVQSLKEEGNFWFRKSNIQGAWTIYVRAVKVLSCAVPFGEEDKLQFRDLAFSLNLNLAACAIKLGKFDMVKCLCSFILEFDKANIKALYRRGVAYFELGMFEESFSDLVTAAKIEPNNPDVVRELGKVEIKVRMDSKGKRSAGVCECLEDTRIGKARKVCLSSTIVDQTNEGSCDVGCSGDKSKDDSGYLPPNKQQSELRAAHDILAEPTFRFVKRRGRGSILNISNSVYQKLVDGGEVSFFHRGKCCLMKVKVASSGKRSADVVAPSTSDPGESRALMDHGESSSTSTMVTYDDQEASNLTMVMPHHSQCQVSREEEEVISQEAEEVISQSNPEKIVYRFNSKQKHRRRILEEHTSCFSPKLSHLKTQISARSLHVPRRRRRYLMSNHPCVCRSLGAKKRKELSLWDDEMLVPPIRKRRASQPTMLEEFNRPTLTMSDEFSTNCLCMSSLASMESCH